MIPETRHIEYIRISINSIQPLILKWISFQTDLVLVNYQNEIISDCAGL
jgi:hypothetical protein